MAAEADFQRMTRILNEMATELCGGELGFKVHYWGAMPLHYDNPVHRHSFFEVCYVLDGEGSYCEADTEYKLLPGTLFCSRPGRYHQIQSRRGLALLFVAYEIHEARSLAESADRYRLLAFRGDVAAADADQSIAVRIWLHLLALSAQEQSPLHRETIRSFACALLVSFYTAFAGTADDGSNLRNEPVSVYLQRAKLFIEDNLPLSLSLQQVAAYLHITERHLSRLFGEQVGQSFSHFVQERRIQKARLLLLETDWTISRIAGETGFESVHYFTKVFKRKTGVPPGQFRKTQLFETPFPPS